MTPIPVMDWQMMRDLALLAPHITPTTGNIYFVHATDGNTTNAGTSSEKPLSTWVAAYNKCDPSHGDTVILMPGHTETLAAVTTGITLNKIGVQTIGLGWGRCKPAITVAGVAIDGISVTAASNRLANIRIVSAAACTALIDVTAADFVADNLVLEHGATPLMGVTLAAGADRAKFINCLWRGTADGPDCAIDIEAHISDLHVENCFFNYGRHGIDLGVIRANVDAVEQGCIKNCDFVGMETVCIDFNSSTAAGANVEGLLIGLNLGMGAATAAIDDANDDDGYGTVKIVCTGLLTESASKTPLATPA